MFQKSLILFVASSYIFSTSLCSYTLKEGIIETLNTHPVIQERLKNYRATQQDLGIAESEYYPQLDLAFFIGHTKSGNLKNSGDNSFDHSVADDSYNNYESSLTFTQNLFDGFGTMHKVDYEEARILAAAYKYLEVSNQAAFDMTRVYIDVLRAHELRNTAKENVQINETIYNKVKDLFDAGLTTDSEVKKIQSSLALARSNFTVQKNNARDNEFKYRRILGRMPDVSSLEKPFLEVELPESRQRALQYALDNNPSLLVAQYDLQGAQALWKQRKKDYYPKIDFEVKQTYNDFDDANLFVQADDRLSAKILLSYNLFRGGADAAVVQQHVSKINQEVEIKRELKRQTIEDLDLSWSAYYMIEEQLVDLKIYSDASEQTLSLYKEEYDLGRRSLLDLLSAQADAINSRSEIITAEYSQLFAKYRILDAMGVLVIAVNGSAEEFTSKVNLYSDDDAHEILDMPVVELDADNDEIPDNLDLCDNSLHENNIMPYGCRKIALDDDHDGIFNAKDECPTTPLGEAVNDLGCSLDGDSDGVIDALDKCPDTSAGEPVNEEGCLLDEDLDGVQDHIDECPATPEGFEVNEIGCAISITLQVNFANNSSEFPNELKERAIQFAEYLNANPNMRANIIGHTSRTIVSNARYNLKLSKRRAESVRNELLKNDVERYRLKVDGKGFEEPIADNATEEGRAKNRRITIELIREDKGGEI